MNLKKYILLSIFVFSVLFSFSQNEAHLKYISGDKLSVSGRAAFINSNCYHRVDSVNLVGLPESVKGLSTHSAGIKILFKTNSKSIGVKWKLKKYNSRSNMTPAAINGLDLYGWTSHSWQFVAVALPKNEDNSAVFVKNLDGKMRHYRIYLPLYSELTDIQIGVDSLAAIEPADKEYLPAKKVAIYGSSITQGASASRPGMAYPSIISRDINIETLNFGFSGSGKMEIEIVNILSKIPADLYILDCVPNTSPQQIMERAVPFVRKLRELKPNVPILMVESIFRESGYWDREIGARVTKQNKAFRVAHEKLIAEGFGQLYYIFSSELIGNDHETTIDGTHLTDLGLLRLAKRVEQEITEIIVTHQ